MHFKGTTAFNSQLRSHLNKEFGASTCSIGTQLAAKGSSFGENQRSNSRHVRGWERSTLLQLCIYCFDFQARFSKWGHVRSFCRTSDELPTCQRQHKAPRRLRNWALKKPLPNKEQTLYGRELTFLITYRLAQGRRTIWFHCASTSTSPMKRASC